MAFVSTAAAFGMLTWCGVASAGDYGAFADPQPVTIEGYPGSAEEPFITPDGRYLLFNSSEAVPDFSLQFASRINAQTFEYRGEIQGEAVNEPAALSGTPSLDDEGNLYFISTRSYFETLSTVYAGHFSEGVVTGVHLVPGVAGEMPGKVDFDVGVSPDGSTLYVSVGQFGDEGGPTSASIVMFDRDGGSFVRDPDSTKILKAVNEVGTLNYGADLASDGLELFFTAASPAIGEAPGIYRATRANLNQPFGQVERVAAITGFAEAPSISADGSTLYYHEQVGGEFEIYTVTRAFAVPAITKLSPKKGQAAGGTSVTITGKGFVGVTGVEFGSTNAASYEVRSATSVTAVSPPGTTGTVEVRVTTSNGESGITSKDHFGYQAPTVTNVSPDSGPASGGIPVTVTGSGFALGITATVFKFGHGIATALDCVSTSECTMFAPAAARTRAVDVRATVGGKTSKKNPSADRFTYH